MGECNFHLSKSVPEQVVLITTWYGCMKKVRSTEEEWFLKATQPCNRRARPLTLSPVTIFPFSYQTKVTILQSLSKTKWPLAYDMRIFPDCQYGKLEFKGWALVVILSLCHILLLLFMLVKLSQIIKPFIDFTLINSRIYNSKQTLGYFILSLDIHYLEKDFKW